MKDTPGTADAITRDVLNDLQCRGGFDSWWDNIDTDTRDEIERELSSLIYRYLEADY